MTNGARCTVTQREASIRARLEPRGGPRRARERHEHGVTESPARGRHVIALLICRSDSEDGAVGGGMRFDCSSPEDGRKILCRKESFDECGEVFLCLNEKTHDLRSERCVIILQSFNSLIVAIISSFHSFIICTG